MNRFDRARMMKLESAVGKVDTAEKNAVTHLQQAGFHVSTMAEARLILSEYREAARLQASQIDIMASIAGGRRAS